MVGSSARQAKNDDTERLTLTVPEAGKLLGVGRNAAYASASRGEIPTIKIGGRILVPRVALQRLLDQVGSQTKPTLTA